MLDGFARGLDGQTKVPFAQLKDRLRVERVGLFGMQLDVLGELFLRFVDGIATQQQVSQRVVRRPELFV